MDKDILYRFFENETTLEEERQIREWMESSPENNKAFFDERRLFDTINLVADKEEIEMYDTSKAIIGKKIIREIIKIAAVVAITLLSVSIINVIRNNYAEPDRLLITVPLGQRINVNLPDGTNAWLNSRTCLEYPVNFKGKNRKVRLDGEAYFEVKPDSRRPFVVETQKGQVEVLGTEFNIEAYVHKGNFITSLIKGSVKVIRENTELILKPNQLSYLEKGAMHLKNIDDYDQYRWKEGLICFRNISFPEIMQKLEDNYGFKIQILNEKVKEYRCTAKFRQSDGINYALRVLQKDANFKFERDEENMIIYIK
jgi:ferric-dicitrate binding protein FerR (iron transport regulator)